MKRLAMGAALGGFALYLFDPQSGEKRRERLLSHLRVYRGSAVQAGRAASQAAESARPLARRMTKAVGRGDWAEALNRGRPSVSLPKLIGAAAIGGVLVYFLEPVHGSERRQRLLSYLEAAGRQAAQKTVNPATAVKARAGHVSDEVVVPLEDVKFAVH